MAAVVSPEVSNCEPLGDPHLTSKPFATLTLGPGTAAAATHYFESLARLKGHIEGRRIKCQLLRRDLYTRVVALPLLLRRS